MNMLTRFDPFRDFDRLVEQLTPLRSSTSASHPMPLDIARGAEGYLVEVDLPGIEPESIDLSVEGNVLTIRAHRASTRMDDMEVLATERPTGTFVRQLTIGDGFDMERIRADYVNGVLSVHLPVAETSKPRKIEVNVDRSSRAIDTTST
jgi:HSP20 family protein